MRALDRRRAARSRAVGRAREEHRRHAAGRELDEQLVAAAASERFVGRRIRRLARKVGLAFPSCANRKNSFMALTVLTTALTLAIACGGGADAKAPADRNERVIASGACRAAPAADRDIRGSAAAAARAGARAAGRRRRRRCPIRRAPGREARKPGTQDRGRDEGRRRSEGPAGPAALARAGTQREGHPDDRGRAPRRGARLLRQGAQATHPGIEGDLDVRGRSIRRAPSSTPRSTR